MTLLVSQIAFAQSGYLPKGLQDGLSVSTPRDSNFDEALLAKGFATAAALPYSHSLLVLRDGKLVAEQYFHGYSLTSPNNLKSVSKSVISALVGIALDKGILKSVEQPLAEIYPEIFRELKDSKKSLIRIKHLLSMSAGIDADDDDSNLNAWAQLDRTRYILERPLLSEPGTKYAYSTAYSFIVSQIITKASKVPTKEFAQKYLFDPLGAKILGWPTDAQGYYWGCHIFMTSRDMAKFGLLFLNGGKYNGKRVISEEWIRLSTSGKIEGSKGNGQYGYFWWSKPKATTPFYYAWGYGGQYIYVVPSKQMVVVMTNDFNSGRPQADIRSVIEDHVIAAAL